MLAVVFGASCSGKSTQARLLQDAVGDMSAYDFDEWAEGGMSVAGRRVDTERWLRRLAPLDEDAILFGGVPGEVLASPSAPHFDGLAFCLLDCADDERARRLRARQAGELFDKHALWNHVVWGVWLRFHPADPQWFPGPLIGDGGGDLRWERWNAWRCDDPRWSIDSIDTTGEEPAARIVGWFEGRRGELHAGTLALSGAWAG